MKKIILAAALLGALCGAALPRGQASADVTIGSDPYTALETLGYSDAREELSLERVLDVGYGKVYRFKQVYEGKEVFRRGVNVSVDRHGKVLSVNSNFLPETPAAERIGEDAALARAEELLGECGTAEEKIYSLDGAAVPAYEISGGGARVLVSAVDGKILLNEPLGSPLIMTEQTDALGNKVNVGVEFNEENGEYTLADYTRNIYAYNADHATTGSGTPYRETSAVFADDIAVSAYYNTVRAYDFYTKQENIGAVRKGINGRNDDIPGNHVQNGEIPIQILVHYGTGYENANCGYNALTRTAVMFVGDGNRYGALYRQAAAADIIAHEYQHAVTDIVCDLSYINEPGALNEAFSDIFGALVEGFELTDDRFWTIGENGVPDGTYVRSISAPTGNSRTNANNMYPLCRLSHDHDRAGCDYGGVHFNSTIISHLQYKIWKELPSFFTRERIGTLWYATLCALRPNASFASFTEQFRAAAQMLDFPEEARNAIDVCLVGSGLLQDESLHAVTFLNADGSLLKEEVVRDGEAATPPEDPTRPSDAKYEYVFSGWDRDLENVTRDMTVRATYERRIRKYRVTFLDRKGNILKQEEVSYGEAATPPPDPPDDASGEFDYEFYMWDRNTARVTGEMTVHAVYTSIRCYTVVFEADGQILSEQRVRENSDAEAPEPPQKESTAQYTYTFERWYGSYSRVTEDRTVSAVFRETLRLYTVSYYSDGELVGADSLPYGSALALAAPPEGKGHFGGWYLDENFTSPAEGIAVNGDLKLYAKWSAVDPLVLGLSVSGTVLLVAAVTLAVCLKKKKKRK